jgi:phosphohistidine phosphatase SixA
MVFHPALSFGVNVFSSAGAVAGSGRLARVSRNLVVTLLVLVFSPPPASALSEKTIGLLKSGGHVILMRHAQTVPGAGDPEGFKLGDCATQRNLSDAGREDARRFGAALRRDGVVIGRVLSSPWCRCIDTAKLALPDSNVEADASLSSFFAVRDPAERRDALGKMRATIAGWSGSGNLLMVSHQQTISALAGEHLAQGAMLVLKPKPGGFDVVAEDQP